MGDTIDWELRGAMAALFDSADPEVLVEGRAGTSKTTGILCKIIDRAERFPGSRHLIARQTRVSLTESVLVTFDRLVGPGCDGYTDVQRSHRHVNAFSNGSTIVWGGLDKPESLFSTEWDTVYIPEATETALDAWDLLGRAMRHNRTDYHQRIADCNPGAPGHWLNKRANPADDVLRDSWRTRAAYDRLQAYNFHQTRVKPMTRMISVHPDNPGYWDADAWDWTPLGRSYVMGTLAGMSGHRRARMFDGRWVAAEGTVFPEFNERLHVCNPFRVPKDWPHFLFYDPGYDHPTAILWIAVAPNGCLYIVDEIYEGGVGVEVHAANVMRRNRADGGRTVHSYYGDPQHAFSETAQSPETIAWQFYKATGVNMTPWPRSSGKGVKEAMVNAVRSRLLMRDESGNACGIKVFRSCENTVNEFQSWSYKRTAKGELPPGDDAYEDKNNHAMDCVCGAVACGLTFERQRVQVAT